MTHRKWFTGAALFILFTLFTVPTTEAKFFHPRDIFGPNHDFHPNLIPPAFPMILQRYRPPPGSDPAGRIRYWNQIMLNANAIDHAPVGQLAPVGEQIGPPRTARAFAIVHIAIFDAVNAIVGGYESYTGIPPANGNASVDAAIAKAAHDTLEALYPSQEDIFDELLAEDLARIPEDGEKQNGIETGRLAARAILELRSDDGSDHEEPVIGVDYFPSNKPGRWRPDPISMSPLALGAYWGSKVAPFVLKYAVQIPLAPYPKLKSHEYAAAYHEVKRLGGDGITTPTERSDEQTIAGLTWSYNGTPGLGTPPRLYNQIAVQVADQMGSDFVDLARLLALVNVGMADGAIACWYHKYKYDFWRPVAGIREADEDNNPRTDPDCDWRPMGAQASNMTGPDFSPPFPAYPSGHATFGGILFQTLRQFYKTDRVSFTLISDELNGITHDNFDSETCNSVPPHCKDMVCCDGGKVQELILRRFSGQNNPDQCPDQCKDIALDRDCGKVRPLVLRRFSSFSEAEEENGQSRIYLGVHWSFDKTEGIAYGRKMAEVIFKNSFKPLNGQQNGGRPASPLSR